MASAVTSDWLSQPLSLKNKKIWVAGHRGLVGSALVRCLEREECKIIHADRTALDLCDPKAVQNWTAEHKPDIVIIAAAKVGGIQANMDEPVDFLHDNMMIAANIMRASLENGVEKLLFLGSSCIYPKEAPNPITEDALMSGPLEPSNAPYALAKIAGLTLAQSYRRQKGCDFISAMPCSLYGPGDRFDIEHSHVIPALIMKAHAAKINGTKTLEIWGSGKPRREFLHVDDLADGLVFLLKNYSGDAPVNIGAGEDIAIQDLAELIVDVTGYHGRIEFNPARPDGVMQKLIDSSVINGAGWTPKISLQQGLKTTYAWYRDNIA